VKLDQLLRAALYLGLAFVGWKVYRKVQGTGASIGQAIGSTLFELTNGDAIARSLTVGSGAVRAINGTAASIDYRTATGREELRLYNWERREFQDVPGVAPPANWRSAPVVLPNFPELKLAGKPWYQPWTADGQGLKAIFQQR